MKNQLRFCLYSAIIIVLVSVPNSVRANPSAQQKISCEDTYVVQANDWLSKIADKFLGDIEAYTVIMVATNQQVKTDQTFSNISNPDRIEVGWKLCIPINQEARALIVEVERPQLSTAPSPADDQIIASAESYTLDDFVSEFHFGRNVEAEWIYSSPEKVEKFNILSEHQAIHDSFGYRANYFWNEHLSNDYYLHSGIFDGIPPQVRLYRAPWGTAFPRFRYPPNLTLPTGITTNQFGWRGRDISFDKPRNTIRIACVGASTTVTGHTLPYSYPELLEHWLNLWVEEEGYDLNIEVINAGREGIGAKDIAAVVRYEILPMDVDYVIYYEGSNQFIVQTMLSYPSDVTFGEPPAGLVPNLVNVDSNDKGLLDYLSEYSALAARARNIVEQFSVTGIEPPKPEQTVIFPEGLDEFNPRRENLGKALNLRKILVDLDQIKQDLDQRETKLFLATFDWFAYDDMVLDPTRHRNLYAYLNRVYWPTTYANMRRMADFQNRVFRRWASDNEVELIEVAEQMPRQPDLYDDAIHNRPLGIRIRAWLNFETIVPQLKQAIENGDLPRQDKVFLREHPYITTNSRVKDLSPG